MNLSIESFDKLNEKILLISIIGTLSSLQHNAISIEESEKFLFSPRMVQILKNKNCNTKIIDLVELCCELEDVMSLIPNQFASTLEKIYKEAIDLLMSYDELNIDFWIKNQIHIIFIRIKRAEWATTLLCHNNY